MKIPLLVPSPHFQFSQDWNDDSDMQTLCNNIIKLKHENNSEYHFRVILLVLQQGRMHLGTIPTRYE
jgi:hypothetical protein